MHYSHVSACLNIEDIPSGPVMQVMFLLTFRAREESHSIDLTLGQIVDQTKLGKSTVKRSITTLEEMGLISSFGSGRGRWAYKQFKIHLKRIYELQPLDPSHKLPKEIETDLNEATLTPLEQHINAATVGHMNIKEATVGFNEATVGFNEATVDTLKGNKYINRNNGTAVNRPYRTGSEWGGKKAKPPKKVTHWSKTDDWSVWPSMSDLSQKQSVDAWVQCLQNEEVGYRVPDSAVLSNIKDGKALIQRMTPFQIDFMTKDGHKDRLEAALSEFLGETITLTLVQEAAA